MQVYIAGIVFLNALTKLFHVSRKDIQNMDDKEWEASIKASSKGIDMKKIFKEAKNIFMYLKRNGILENTGNSVDIKPEDDR